MTNLTTDLLEAASRKLCEIRGQDADEYVQYRHPEGYAVCVKRKRWASAAEEINKFLEIVAALDSIQNSDLQSLKNLDLNNQAI